jgi:hypothetical protein
MTSYELGSREIAVPFPAEKRYFSLFQIVQTGSDPIGTGGSFLGVKFPRREADHSPS